MRRFGTAPDSFANLTNQRQAPGNRAAALTSDLDNTAQRRETGPLVIATVGCLIVCACIRMIA